MRMIHLVLSLLLVAFVARPAFAADASRTTITAILVFASNERGPTDPRLAPYEANLKSSLRYESFRFGGQGSATVAAGGTATISLPNDNRLSLAADNTGRIKVSYGSTDVAIPRGQTVVLGRRQAAGGEVSAIIVIAN